MNQASGSFGLHRRTLNISCTLHMLGQEHKISLICTDIQYPEWEYIALQLPDLKKKEKDLVKSEFMLKAR